MSDEFNRFLDRIKRDYSSTSEFDFDVSEHSPDYQDFLDRFSSSATPSPESNVLPPNQDPQGATIQMPRPRPFDEVAAAGLGEGFIGTLGLLGELGMSGLKLGEKIDAFGRVNDLSRFLAQQIINKRTPPDREPRQLPKRPRPKGLLTDYNYGDTLGKATDFGAKAFPRYPNDPPGVQTIFNYAGGGGVINALAKKAAKLGIPLSKYIADKWRLSIPADVGAGAAAAAVEELLPELNENSGGLASAGAGVPGGMVTRKAAMALVPTVKALSKIPFTTQGIKDAGADTKKFAGDILDEALKEAPAIAEQRAFQNLVKVAGGDLEFARFLKAVDELPPAQGLDNFSDLAERLIDDPQVGQTAARITAYLNKQLRNQNAGTESFDVATRVQNIKTAGEDAQADILRNVGASLESPQPTQAGRALQKTMPQYTVDKKAAGDIFEEMDGLTRIDVSDEAKAFDEFLNKKFPVGFRANDGQIFRSLSRKQNLEPPSPDDINEKTVNYLTQVRTKAGEIAQKNPETVEAFVSGKLRRNIDQILENAANKGVLAGDDLANYRRGQAAYREFKEKYPPFVRKLIDPKRVDESQVSGRLLSKSISPEKFAKIVNVVPKAELPQFRAGLIDELIIKNTTDSILDHVKLARDIRANREKLSKVMTPTHIRNFEQVVKNMGRRARADKKSQPFEKALPKLLRKTFAEHLTQIFSNRLRWKYPAQAKVIQVAAARGKVTELSLQNLIDGVTLDMAYDPVVLKRLTQRYKPGLLDKNEYEKVFKEFMNKSESVMSKVTDFMIGGAPKQAILAGLQSERSKAEEE